MDDQPSSSSAAQDRFSAYREKAERRGRIRHPEGNRYETPDWLDVLVLLDENERLTEEVERLRELAVEVTEASDLHEWGHAVTKARSLAGTETNMTAAKIDCPACAEENGGWRCTQGDGCVIEEAFGPTDSENRREDARSAARSRSGA